MGTPSYRPGRYFGNLAGVVHGNRSISLNDSSSDGSLSTSLFDLFDKSSDVLEATPRPKVQGDLAWAYRLDVYMKEFSSTSLGFEPATVETQIGCHVTPLRQKEGSPAAGWLLLYEHVKH